MAQLLFDLSVRRRVGVILLVLLPAALSGCLADPLDCVLLHAPTSGSEVEYSGVFSSGAQSAKLAYTIGADATVVAGDGTPRSAVAIQSGGTGMTSYVDLATGDDVVRLRPDIAIVRLDLNPGTPALGAPFWGRCLKAGDYWTQPFFNDHAQSTFLVEHANNEGLTIRQTRPAMDTSVWLDNNREPLAYVFHFEQKSPFPDRFEVYNTDGDNSELPAASWTRTSMAYQPRALSRPIVDGLARDLREEWAVFPPMDSDFFRNAPYHKFVSRASSYPYAEAYLAEHPAAFASYVRFVEVNEDAGRSTAWVWQALIRDESAAAIEVQWVHRCFHRATDQTIYGACHDQEQYRRQTNDPLAAVDPARAVTAAPEISKKPTAPFSRALAAAVALNDEQPLVEVEWYAFPRESPGEVTPGRGGWVLTFGIATGSVNYTTIGQPYGNSSRVDGQSAIADDAGWVFADWRPMRPLGGET